ncbi:glycoside hydrolase family 24 protein [Trichosporon asahii var. asahii CBS 8904]|uniref:Glycoside hydrolase family 24 protein n=1 Tax=Trichosporon asahii var. asahii (strain CBS 8904) TaxID=1220162 RepID=K1WL46_TRIAC|nr:glycoside hydrolase family 24 protein [Trichosporon asahii var. asahii CBS 8904]
MNFSSTRPSAASCARELPACSHWHRGRGGAEEDRQTRLPHALAASDHSPANPNAVVALQAAGRSHVHIDPETEDLQDFFAHTLPPDDLDVAGDNAASGTPIADAPSGPESHLKPLPDWPGVLFEGDGDLCEAVRLGVAAVERLNEAKGTKLIRPGHCSSTGAAAAVASSFPGASTALAAPYLLSRYPSRDSAFPEPRGWGNNDVGLFDASGGDFDSARLLREHLSLYLPAPYGGRYRPGLREGKSSAQVPDMAAPASGFLPVAIVQPDHTGADVSVADVRVGQLQVGSSGTFPPTPLDPHLPTAEAMSVFGAPFGPASGRPQQMTGLRAEVTDSHSVHGARPGAHRHTAMIRVRRRHLFLVAPASRRQTANADPAGSQGVMRQGLAESTDIGGSWARFLVRDLSVHGVSPLAAALTVVLVSALLTTVLAATASAASYPIKTDGVRCRSGPGTSYDIKKTYSAGDKVTLSCYKTGTSVEGNTYWDKTGDGCYVSDYYVKTGSTTPVVSKCGSTSTGTPGCSWVNADGIALIQEFESFQPRPYKDPKGLWTVGYGHLCANGGKDSTCSGTGFKYPLTLATAGELLKKDIPRYTKCLRDNLNEDKVKLNKNQWAALSSFVFNLGCGNFQRSDLMARLNKGEDVNTVIAAEFPRWNKADGAVLTGLVRRRAAEVALAKKTSHGTSKAFPTAPKIDMHALTSGGFTT